VTGPSEIERLRECEERYWSLVEDSLHGVIIFQGSPPKPAFVSRSAARTLGITPEDMEGIPHDEMYRYGHPEEPKDFAANYDFYLTGGTFPEPRIRRLIGSDGSIRWVAGIPSACRYKGRPAVQIAFQDVTEKVEAQTRLRESEQMFRALVENANDGILVANPGGRHLFANDRAAAITGYTKHELLSIGFQELGHPDELPKLKRNIRRRLAGEPAAHQYDTIIVHKDGHSVPVEITGASSVWRGEVADVIIMRDLSERKKTEEDLRESRNLYQSLLDLSPDPICVLQENAARFVNRAFTEVFGFRLDDLHGPAGFYAPIPEESRSDTAALLESHLADPGAQRFLEMEMQTKYGRKMACEVSAAQIQYRGGAAVLAIIRDVSPRRRAEEALQASEERYRNLVDVSPDPVVVVDEERHLFVSRAYTKVLGYTEEDVRKGLPLLTAVREEDREWVPESFRRVIEGGSPSDRPEIVLVAKDGRLVYAETSTARIAYEGKPALMVVLRDVTQQREAKRELEASERRYRAIVEDQVEMICRFLPDSTLTFVNKAYADYFGAEGENLVGKSFLPFVHETEQERVHEAIRSLTPENPRVSHEHRVRGPDGEMKWHLWTNHAFFDDQGRVLEIQAVGRDVTQRKLAEERLRASEKRYRAIVEDQTELVCRYGSDGRFTFVNEACCRFTGLKREVLLGRSFLPFLPEGERGAVWNRITSLTPEKPINTIEQHAMNKDGELRWMLWTNRALFDENGAFHEYQAVGSDITQRKEAEELVRRHKDRLEEEVQSRMEQIEQLERLGRESEKLAATGRMAARIAHEINNPLAGIKNSFLLVKDAVPEDHPYYSYVGRIEREIDRIADIVRQMYGLHPERSQAARPFWVDHAIRDVVLLLEGGAAKSEVRVDVDLDASHLRVSLPEDLFRQVLFNVVQNAIEAAPGGTVVRVRATLREGSLVIAVRDRGKGIPEEVQEKIFEPFFTTKEGRAEDGAGLGLGLSISKGIVDALGGTIVFKVHPRGGTLGEVVIPIHEGEEDRNE